jgi:hypothetical protein
MPGDVCISITLHKGDNDTYRFFFGAYLKVPILIKFTHFTTGIVNKPIYSAYIPV